MLTSDLKSWMKDLTKKFEALKTGLIFYIEEKMKPLEESVKRSEKIWQNVSVTLDWLVGKFTKFDQELTILIARYPDLNDKLENHEKRIQTLEKKTSYT